MVTTIGASLASYKLPSLKTKLSFQVIKQKKKISIGKKTKMPQTKKKLDGFELFFDVLQSICLKLLCRSGENSHSGSFYVSNAVAGFLSKRPYNLIKNRREKAKDCLHLLNDLEIWHKTAKQHASQNDYYISKLEMRFVANRDKREFCIKNQVGVIEHCKADEPITVYYHIECKVNAPLTEQEDAQLRLENERSFGSFHASDTSNNS